MKSEWLHDQKLSFQNVRSGLGVLREALEKSIADQKSELNRYVALRDSLKK